MELSYTVMHILLIFALTGCIILAKRSTKPIRHAIAWLEATLMLPIAGNLILTFSEDKTLEMTGYYIYFLGINSVLYALVNFTNTYCAGTGDGTRKPTVMYIMLLADAAQIMLNTVFGHAFDIAADAPEGTEQLNLIVHFGLTIHRIIDYIIVFCVILIFTLVALQIPKIYREKYTVLLAAMIALGLLQGYYLITKSAYDRSVVGYGIFGLILFYFAIYYRPLKLLDSILSYIVSDLSEAFFIFDTTGKCIWANDEGCRLVNFTGKNYEDISALLKTMFGDCSNIGEQQVKKEVSDRDAVRFYALEEKQVKDSSGKSNGFYLRIEDVTDEEHEIQVRDEQIGQISREAYKDALTHVGNKAAFDGKVNELNAQIADGLTEFAVVMVDLNNLKQINDVFGHKEGDLYIKGCCHLICDVFKHSPVFRIGGDEFVVILRGTDYSFREQLADELRTAYADAWGQSGLDPWLRYSAAVGLAEYAEENPTFDAVFRLADQRMYEEKNRFKAENGSYR